MKTAEFGQPCAAVPQPGTCRVCGCVEDRACLVPQDRFANDRPCGWADHTRTLCDNPDCVAAAKRELGLPAGAPDGLYCGHCNEQVSADHHDLASLREHARTCGAQWIIQPTTEGEN